jgi:hypothetical protein
VLNSPPADLIRLHCQILLLIRRIGNKINHGYQRAEWQAKSMAAGSAGRPQLEHSLQLVLARQAADIRAWQGVGGGIAGVNSGCAAVKLLSRSQRGRH